MNISTREEGPVTVIALQGKVMHENELNELKETVKTSMLQGRNDVLMDLTEVDWMNSSGLGTLIMLRGLLLEIGGRFRLAGLRPSVLEVMKINKLDTVFDIRPSVVQALSAVK